MGNEDLVNGKSRGAVGYTNSRVRRQHVNVLISVWIGDSAKQWHTDDERTYTASPTQDADLAPRALANTLSSMIQHDNLRLIADTGPIMLTQEVGGSCEQSTTSAYHVQLF